MIYALLTFCCFSYANDTETLARKHKRQQLGGKQRCNSLQAIMSARNAMFIASRLTSAHATASRPSRATATTTALIVAH
jgi:hypothetical protein